MDLSELFSESALSLTTNKIRTVLAMLGVVIGIGSVIALLSLGQASQKSITNQIQSLGTNLLTVRPGASMSGGVRGASGGGQTLSLPDALAVGELPLVAVVSPEVSQNAQIVAGRNNSNNRVYGVKPSYLAVHNLEIVQGSFISEIQDKSMSRVVVLGPIVAADLFGEGISPLGQQIRINNQAFSVIGVAQEKGAAGFNNPDEAVYVPFATAQKIIFGIDYLNSLSVSAADEDKMTETEESINQLLLQRHKISDPTQADFSIMSQDDIIGMATSVTGTLTALLAAVAAISLIVGGIGIMNIMLVTVTERTREIGLRKALGAKKKIIIYQFLLEAVMITFIGGLIGIILGILVSFLLSLVMSLPFILSGVAVTAAFGVSALVGIVFGWYPASKAAKLQPIEALRYE